MSNVYYVLLHSGGKIVEDQHGVSYSNSGPPKIVKIRRGMSYQQIRKHMLNAIGKGGHHGTVSITYRFSTNRYPHTNYFYTAVPIIDDESVGLIFDVLQSTPGYTAEFYLEENDAVVDWSYNPMGNTCIGSTSQVQDNADREPYDYGSGTPIYHCEQGFSVDEGMMRQPYSPSRYEDEVGVTGNVNMPLRTGTLDQNMETTNAVQALVENERQLEEVHRLSIVNRDETDDEEEEAHHSLMYEGDDENEDETRPHFQPPSQMFTENTWVFHEDSSPQMPHNNDGWDETEDMQKGLIFSSKQEVIRAVKNFSLRNNYVAEVIESTPKIYAVRCKNGCEWRVRAIKRATHGFFEVTQYKGPHTCLAVSLTQDHPMLDSNLIEHYVRTLVQADPSIKILLLQTRIREKFEGYYPSYAKTWDAKQKAIAKVFGDWDKSFQTLPLWCSAMVDANPGLLSDRHAGLLAAIRNEDLIWQPPYGYHRYCMRHIGANFQKNYRSAKLRDLVKAAASEHQVRKMNIQLERIKELNEEAFKDLEKIPLEVWTAAYDGGRRFGATTTNLSECYNNVLKGARHLPVTSLVQHTFYKCVTYFADRAGQARAKKNAGDQFSKHAMKMFNAWALKCRRHTVTLFDREEGTFEVRTPVNPQYQYKGNHLHSVNLSQRTCTCNKLQNMKIPCSHVQAACRYGGIDPYQFIDTHYTVDKLLATYTALNFHPVLDVPYWRNPGGPALYPNMDRRRGRGRPKTSRMRNEMDWIEIQPKQSCGLCGKEGHNKRRCPSRGGESSSYQQEN
ncbi:hypothetical protein Vadar_005720 [Vaccinium darrowii]|uniref:Uncharacterized protein n=1 Tax=Vaccinium darrowii TaxID=229202 RepID=A0ACB7YJE6_9ERIC|nr:hypothetical protein Vadar_005720 [Vaccinium darrowii]